MSSVGGSDAEHLACPRCNSCETKFCYYNNYSTAQPRHFCKNCKRYWTAGGSLRNVPVGGGLRKSKKSKLSKHARDLLSASPGEFVLDENLAATLTTPSSPADCMVDDIFATPTLPYCPIFDCTPLSELTGQFMPLSPPYYLQHINQARSFGDHDTRNLSDGSPYQSAPDRRYRVCHPHIRFGGGDSGQYIYSAISSERSEDDCCEEKVVSSSNKCYSSMERRQECQGGGIKAYSGIRQFVDESKVPGKQSCTQCSAEDRQTCSQDENTMNAFLIENEDEGLGNVINVRYPYDWEQVSEVLFGGTQDYLRTPTF